jgi:hypothetical protein
MALRWCQCDSRSRAALCSSRQQRWIFRAAAARLMARRRRALPVRYVRTNRWIRRTAIAAYMTWKKAARRLDPSHVR